MSARTIAAAPAPERMNVGWKRSTMMARTPARKRTVERLGSLRMLMSCELMPSVWTGAPDGTPRSESAPATDDAFTIPSITCSRSASVAP